MPTRRYSYSSGAQSHYGICISASDADSGDGRGSRPWVATGPSQALVTSAGGVGAQQPRNHLGWILDGRAGPQGWTLRKRMAQPCMAPAAAMLAAARSTGLGLIAHIPPAAPVAKTRRDRHDG